MFNLPTAWRVTNNITTVPIHTMTACIGWALFQTLCSKRPWFLTYQPRSMAHLL